MKLTPCQVTLRHPVLRGETSQSETILAVDVREAVYEMLERHPEVSKWHAVDIQVRQVQGLADSANV